MEPGKSVIYPVKSSKPGSHSAVTKTRRSSRVPTFVIFDSEDSAQLNESSLGILSLDNLNLTGENQTRLEHYELSNSLLKSGTGLPAHYFEKNFATPSVINGLGSESTVNESDLLEQFEDVSTPRSSLASASNNSMNLEEFKHQLVNSDESLSKLYQQFSKASVDFELQDESFVLGDLAAAKIAQHEQSWMKKRGVLGGASVRGDSMFIKKSELADLCFKTSSERDNNPASLVTAGDKSQSILSYTAFENADTTAKVYDLLRGGNKENRSRISDCKNRPTFLNILKDSSNICYKSVSSVRTVSSLEHLSGGKLPIETNRTELVWGCVKVGKKVPHTFVLRNKSQNKLHFQITSSSACFRLLTDQGDSDAVTTLPLLLYPAESRCLKVVFSPFAVGAFVEMLSFTPISEELKSQQTKRQLLKLYGYGGHALIDILNVAKDSNMKMWLSFGKFQNKSELTQTFTVKNMGTLTAFVCLSFTSKILFGFSQVSINPTELVLNPKSQAIVSLTFTPTKVDVNHMLITAMSQVIEIGLVQIISGAEPLRARIRNLCRKLEKESAELPNQLIVKLSQKFPNEKMPLDIQKFTETVGAMTQLMQNLVIKEIMLTIEKDPDSSVLGQVIGIDESSMFHSLSEGMTTAVANNCNTSNLCSVEPLQLVLTPPIKTADCVLLISHSNAPLQFQTSVVPNGVLRVSPSEGIVSPDETVIINVTCDIKNLKQNQQQNQLLQVSIDVDNDIFEIDVKIIFVKAVKLT